MSQKAPQVGDLVRYYSNGWRHGHVVEVKPRKKVARIKPCGPGRAIVVNLIDVEGVE